MSREALDTPWGNLGPATSCDAAVGHRYNTSEVRVATDAGRAVTSFHLDFQHEAVPELLRVVMLSGYSAARNLSNLAPSGESTLRTGGTLLNWRAQAYLDPTTGGLSEHSRISVMLVDAAGKTVSGYEPAEKSVRAAVTDAFAKAHDEDPGMVARVYAVLMRDAKAELDDQVGHAERALREAKELRDRAAALMEQAEERAAGVSAPAP